MALALPAAVTLDEMPAVLRSVTGALGDGAAGPLVIDASAVQELDTSAVALLLHAGRLAAAQGRQVRLLGAPDKLLALARLYGIDSLLPASVSSVAPGPARSDTGGRSA
ncbi:MAG: STAS domain-containing protein [Rubrivivax sp.]|nr:STAS domain-containing protein [Rubrivivax sp.]